ncbi:MAG: hypothetical protein DRH93_21155 [Deltaproteobacteria bacterium]|nr:MAG: hypothetical protein DRH93_21155 [Deltaproteobacteria bacterium]
MFRLSNRISNPQSNSNQETHSNNCKGFGLLAENIFTLMNIFYHVLFYVVQSKKKSLWSLTPETGVRFPVGSPLIVSGLSVFC